MDPSDLDLTQVIQAPEDTEDQNANSNIRALLKVEVDVAPPRVLTFTLKAGSNVIGRSHLCDVVIGNSAVSKQHARLELDKDGITITDLGSQNKTKIGKRVLKPKVCFNLDYNETFSLAGIPAHVLRDEDNGGGDDMGSDTCSESLLNAVEVVEDQAGVVEPVVHSNSSTVDCNSERVEGELEQPTSSTAAGLKQVVEPSPPNDAKASSSHESRSSGSFNLPEMPSLDYTQSESSQLTEPCAEDGSLKKDGAAKVSQEALAPANDTVAARNAAAPRDAEAPLRAPAGLGDGNAESAAKLHMQKESHLTAETQPYGDDAEYTEVACLRQDGLPGDEADEADRLNAPTQSYSTQYSEATCLRQDGLAGDEADEVDRLNAPTQPYNTQYSEATCLQQDGLPADEADEADRLNAPTQPYIDDTRNTDAASLLSDGLPGAEADEADRLNAPTQGYEDEGTEEEAKSRNALAQTSKADDEQERLNAVTQSLPDNDDDAVQSDRGENEGALYGRTLAGDRTRRLLSGPSDLSFVLCEATQPDNEDEDDYFCPPTQKDISPVLKVHALLKSRKERREAANEEEEGDKTNDETDDETPNLSPKTTVDETPPHSPSFVPESDPDDDDVSMVTARRSMSLLNSTGLTVYEDCVTPGHGFGSPVIGSTGNVGKTSCSRLKTGERRQRRGMSLKKPSHETIVEQPAQECVAGAEYLQEGGLELSKAARRLDYIEETDAGDGNECISTGDISGIEDLPSEISEPGKCAASETEAMPSPSGLASGRPSARNTDASERDDAAADNEEPFLHMSEIGDFDTLCSDTAGAPAPVQHSSVIEGDKPTADCLGGTASKKREDAASAQALDDELTEAKEGSRDGIGAVEPVLEGKDTASEQTCYTDKMSPLADADGKEEPEKFLSETEEEGDRTSTTKGRKKKAPTAKKARTKKEAAPPNSKKDASGEPVAVPPRRSSGRQNAGAKMKSLLSLEKRTSASGKFREDSLSQEICEKQGASDNTDFREAENKAPKRTSKRGLKDSAKEATSSPLMDNLSGTSPAERNIGSPVGEEGTNVLSSKCDRDVTRGEKSSGQKDADSGKDKKEECPSEKVPLAEQEDEHTEDVGSIVSFLPPCESVSDDYVNATIDTCFSEPFPSFSQVMAECRDLEKVAAEDLKRKQKEELEEKAPNSPAQGGDGGVTEDSSVKSNQDPALEESPGASRSKESLKEDAAVVQSMRKKNVPSTEAPCKTTRRATQESLLPTSEVLVEDTEFQESEAPKSALSGRSQRARPPAIEPKRSRRKAKQLDVVEDTEQPRDDTEADDVRAESGADEDTPNEFQQSEAPVSTLSRRSQRNRQGASPSAVGPKQVRRKAKQLEVFEETEQLEDDNEVDHVHAESGADEDTPSELQQSEAPESASSQRSQRTRRGSSPPAIEPKRARRKAKLLEVVEETELPEDKTEVESGNGEGGADRSSRIRKTPTASQEEKSASRSHSTKASRLGVKKAKQSQEQDAEWLDEPAPTTVEDQTEKTGLQATENTRRGKRSTKLSLDRNSKTAADDLDFELNDSQSSRTSQRGKRGEKLSQEQDSRSLVENPLDDSALNASVESGQMSSQRKRKGAKQSQGKDDLPPNEGTAQDSLGDTPALDEAAVDDSWAGVSELSGSQSPRTSRRGKKGKKLSQEEGHKPLVEKDTESQNIKTCRRAGKGAKLSQQEDEKLFFETAVVSTPNESVVEHKPETVGTSQRGKRRVKVPEIYEDLPATESAASDATEESAVDVGSRNVRAPRGGKKGAKNRSQEQGNKKNKSSAVNTKEECPEAANVRSPRSSRRAAVRADLSNSRGDRASEEKTLTSSTEAPSKAKPAVPKTSQLGRKTKASSGQEQPPKNEPIKVSSRNKKQSIDEDEVVVEAKPPNKRPATRCRASKMAPPAQAPVAKKRNVQGKGSEDPLPTSSTIPVQETLEENSPNCSPAKIARAKRHVASMSFGEGRQESEGEAMSNEEVELQEIEMMPGPKSKRKPGAKNVVKQEEVMEASVSRRGKRKAALAEAAAPGTPPKVKREVAERGAVMSPPSSKKTLKRKPKILFTGIDCTGEEEVVKELGGAIATTASTCTHLVTDKFRRTVKSLCCIGKGTPIVDVAWIKKCQEAKTFVEHMPFLLKDRKAEKSLKFVLGETLGKASDSGVLQGWSIHATPHVLPSPADLKEIVTCAGGKYLAKMPTRATSGSTVIISCKEDLKACVQAKKNGVPIVSVEFVLSGLLQYNLDVGAHSLD